MAIIAIEGWEHGVVAPVDTTISNQGPVSVTGRDGVGKALGRTATFETFWKKSFVSGSDRIYGHLGWFIDPAGVNNSNPHFAIFTDGGATQHITVHPLTDRKLHLLRGGTEIQASTLLLNTTGTWYSVEYTVVISDTVGEVIVKVDGVEYLHFNGDTKNAGTSTRPDAIRVGAGYSGAYNMDDLVIADTTGTVNNTWLGDCSVVGLRPVGNGANSGLLGSDGNSVDNYLNVDEFPLNTTDYNGSPTSGARDTYDMSTITKVGNVLAVQQYAYAAKSDAGAKFFKNVRRSGGGTVVAGTSRSLSTTYTLYGSSIWETDADGTPWTVASVNAHEFGFEVSDT